MDGIIETMVDKCLVFYVTWFTQKKKAAIAVTISEEVKMCFSTCLDQYLSNTLLTESLLIPEQQVSPWQP